MFRPKFTFRGFRFALVQAVNVSVTSIQALTIFNSVHSSSAFRSTDKTIQQIFDMAKRSQMSNLHGIPTDCPQRDERLGWMADAQVSAMLPFFETSGLFENFLDEIVVSQNEADSGALIDFVPDCDPEDGNPISMCNRSYARPADPSWGVAFPKILWHAYLQNQESLTLLEKFFQPLEKFVRQMQSMADSDGLLRWGKLGDWYAVYRCDQAPVSVAQQYDMLVIFDSICKLLNRENPFAGDLEVVRSGFASSFLRPDGGANTETGEMCVQAIALASGLVPSDLISPVRNSLMFNVQHGNVFNNSRVFPGHLVCGVIGTPAVLKALSFNSSGLALARAAVSSPDFPSFGFMAAMGSTTLWETWADLCSQPLQKCDGEDSSKNHVMLASVANWILDNVISIASTGLIRVRYQDDVEHVWRRTRFGAITYDKYGAHLRISVPAGAQAEFDCGDQCEGVTKKLLGAGNHIFQLSS